MNMKQFLKMLENVKIYYHGNSYKETVNYCFIDERNRLKRLYYQEANKKAMINSINDILYYLSIINPEILETLKKDKLTI